MKDEIKEIIDKLNEDKDYDDYVDYKGSYFKPLLDYITNLQEKLDFTIDRNDEKQERIDKARAKLQSMFDNGNEETILDDLLELYRVLGDDE